MPARLPDPPDLDDLVQRYLAGDSTATLAHAWQVSPSTIVRWLDSRRVERRDQSSAAKVRDGDSLARAWAARRGTLTGPISAANAQQRALTRERLQLHIGDHEHTVADALRSRGLDVRHQVAVDRYNLDLAVHDVAVEVWHSLHHPTTRPTQRRRVVQLLDRGWRVVYVWVHPEGTAQTPAIPRGIGPGMTDQLVAAIHDVRSAPTRSGQYRVIRGDGEDVTRPRNQAYESTGRASAFHDLAWLGGPDSRISGHA